MTETLAIREPPLAERRGVKTSEFGFAAVAGGVLIEAAMRAPEIAVRCAALLGLAALASAYALARAQTKG